MGMGGVCARQDNTQEWRSVIEISIKEVISGVIAEVLFEVCVCVCARERLRDRECGKNGEYSVIHFGRIAIVLIFLCLSAMLQG